jgi:signal transduction histidine kinase
VIRTIRSRVTVVAAVLVAVLVVAMGLIVVFVLRAQLADTLDDSLRHRADVLAVLIEGGERPIFLDEDTAVRIVPYAGAARVLGDVGAVPNWEVGGATLVTRRSVDDRHVPLRMFMRTVAAPDGPAVLQVATRLDDVNEPTRIVVRSLAVAMPGVVVLIALLVWWLVGRTLRPVERIRAEMADITVHDLSRRVPEPGTGDDIDRLARTTNTTLATLEQAVARQQRFVADASHELRSPIARMRAALEVDQVDPAAADLAATHRGLLDDTVALQQLVEDLLHLARSDARVAKARPPARVDLDVVLRNEVAAVSERGRVAVRVGAIDAAAVEGQPHELARAVRNLLDNAERHAASLVTVALTVLDGAAHLTIADDGPGIPIADRERVFERFARLDDARTIASGGTGLGLAITREIVADHRGTVVVEGDGETRLVVTLPLAPAVAVQPSFSPAGA